MERAPGAVKRALRRAQRARRLELSETEAARRSESICDRVLSVLGVARRVASFWPMLERREVDLRELDRTLRERAVAVAYPRHEADARQFLFVTDPHDFERHPLGFLQPKSGCAVATQLDAVVAPALAASSEGHRLGYGAGFYDRALAALAPVPRVIVTVYDFEVVPTLPAEDHDFPVDLVVTDARTVTPECSTGRAPS